MLGRSCDLRAGARVEPGAVVGEGCIIGTRAEVRGDVKVYPYKVVEAGAQVTDPFVCSQHKDTRGKKLSPRNLEHRWSVAIKILWKDRVKRLSIHKGRHTFCWNALAGGRTILEVRDAAGHASISTTNIYLQTAAAARDQQPGQCSNSLHSVAPEFFFSLTNLRLLRNS